MPELEHDPFPDYPHEFTLVWTIDPMKARREAQGRNLDLQQKRLTDLGFPWDYWLPLELAENWRSNVCPKFQSRESVQQWENLVRESAGLALGARNLVGSQATGQGLLDGLVHDRELLGQYDPKLVELAKELPVDLKWSKANNLKHWAREFGVSESTLRRRLKEGIIRHKKLGCLYQIAVPDLPAQSQK